MNPGDVVLIKGEERNRGRWRFSVKAKLLERRVSFVFFVRVYLQLVVIVYSFLLLYCLLSFWCHHRCVMLRNLSSFLV